MSRSLSGEATAEEELALQQFMQTNPSFQQQYELMKRMWHTSEKQDAETIDESEKKNISHILQLAKAGAENEPSETTVIPLINKRKLYLSISSAAAAIFIAVSFWIFSEKNDPHTQVAPTQTLVTENGSRTRTILPDGSTVWLNAGSHISFNKNFSGSTREVTLDGEAYFDVVKQPQRPFIVHVSGYDIKVLGTAFNVKSYPADKTVETTLLRGLVQVTKQGAKKQEPIFLRANEKLIVDKYAADSKLNLPYNEKAEANTANTKYLIQHIDSAQKESEKIETAWVYNRLEFKGESFAGLAQKLERWYNVKIVFDDGAVQKLNFYGSFENETIEQALTALKKATPFNYKAEGKEFHITSWVPVK